MPTYSIYEVYQHLKRISDREELRMLLDVLIDERRDYRLADYQCLKKLFESKRVYLELLDNLEYRIVKHAKKK